MKKRIKNKKMILKVLLIIILMITSMLCLKNIKYNVYAEEIEYPVYKEGDVVYFDPVTEDDCTKNTFSASKVTNGTSTCYKWRVLSTDDTKDNSIINVQLDHNIGEKVNWISSSDMNEIINNSDERTIYNTTYNEIGPMTALKELQRITSSWVRVPLLNYEYDTSNITNDSGGSYNYNYGKLTCVNGKCTNGKNETLVENLRARLVTAEELKTIAEKNISDVEFKSGTFVLRNLADWYPKFGSDAYPSSNYQFYYTDIDNYSSYIMADDLDNGKIKLIWLIENITNNSSVGWTTYGLSSASGYWTLTPTAFSYNQSWDVSDYGTIYPGLSYTSNGSSIGVRPVIKLDKNNLKKYTVTFNDEDRITTKKVFDGSKVSPIDSKGKTNHTFLYWGKRKNGTEFDFDTPITKDITLYAVYNKNGCSVVDRTTAVDIIEDLYETNATSNNLAYDNTSDNNLRYINNNPNNYISFNNELWRIIGIFNTEDENGSIKKRLKIVRNDPIGNYSWDTTHHGSGSEGPGNKNTANGINEWSQADLMYLLNPGYEEHKEPNYYNDSTGKIVYDDEYLANNSLYYNSQSGTCFISSNNGYTTCDFTSTGLKEESHKYIDRVKWYTGAINNPLSSYNSYDIYNIERQNATGKDNITKSTFSSLDDIERTTSWIGSVGLLYPSDTIFSSGDNPYVAQGAQSREDCFSGQVNGVLGACSTTNNWLFNPNMPIWSITPTNGGIKSNGSLAPYYVIALSGTAIYEYTISSSSSYVVRPTLYLKPDVTINSGDGSVSNPYIISLIEQPTCTVNVTYNDDGRITTKTIPEGDKAEEIDVQGKDGYTFKYWSTDKTTEFDFDTPIDVDITLYAVYEKNPVDCEFKITSNVYVIDNEKLTINKVSAKATKEEIEKNIVISTEDYEITDDYVILKCNDIEKKYQIIRFWNPKTGQKVIKYTLIIGGLLTIILLLIVLTNKKTNKK